MPDAHSSKPTTQLTKAVHGLHIHARTHSLARALQATGREPDFTNNAIIRGQDQFTETLDYIFISKHWQVDAVKPLPARPAYAHLEVTGQAARQECDPAPTSQPVDIDGKPYPDSEQPSDHLMLAATLSLSQ